MDLSVATYSNLYFESLKHEERLKGSDKDNFDLAGNDILFLTFEK